ncbi:DUF4031 domain-containing protein [Pseudophaeobacter sp. 1A09344]|uniref:DUF4031 domain-containing protein n=1 Tax=Pseudophaeobacter sp. 1A09344 TaxID=3098144 RepID=UPI0034D3DF1B
MAVYVDAPRHRVGRMIMCHMLADNMDELLAMADRIGVARKWFQPKSHPHFDICKAMRVKAVAAGAVEVDRRQLVDVMKRYRARLATDRQERAAVDKAKAACLKGDSHG